MDTDEHVTLENGIRGEVPCRVTRQVDSITWSKGPNFAASQRLLVFQFYNNEWSKLGSGYTEGLYDIEANFSLVINDVKIQDDGFFFFCEILDRDTGQSFANKTELDVIGRYCGSLIKHKDNEYTDCTCQELDYTDYNFIDVFCRCF